METLAGAGAGLALLPAVLTAWNLLLYRAPPRPTARTAGARPGVSVLIPARDEEANIEAAVRAVLANRDVALEVIVLDDGSTDATAAIVAALAAGDGRVRLERAPPLPRGWCGKQHACHVLAGLARHELLVFIDADVRLAPDALGRMAAFLAARPAVGLASGVPRQETGSFAERLVIPLILFLLLGYLPLWGMRRLPWAAFGAGCGQLFVARREAYLRAGGHAAIRRSLHDGVALPRAFRHAGIRTDLFDATALASCRMYRDARQVWEGFSKNATEGMATPAALPVWTVLLGGGHVLPWLLLPGLLLAGGPAAAVVPAALGVAAGLAPRLALALRFRQGLAETLLHPLAILVLLALQWVALIRAVSGHAPRWRGRTYHAG